MLKNYILAIFTLMGTIIGVGMFTIPYAINKSGLMPLFVFIIGLSLIQYYLHSLFAEAVLSTEKRHRLPGLVGQYSSKRNKKFTFIIEIIGDYGSSLAYIIVGGIFLNQLLSPYFGGDLFIYASILFIFVSAVTFFDIKLIAGAEFILTFMLLLVIGLITWRGLGFIAIGNYRLVDWGSSLSPYGPILFALSGMAAIPEVCRLLAYHKDKIKSAIAWGTFIPAALTLFFVLLVLGITGGATSPDTLVGLGAVLRDGVITLALIFGLLAVVTSYIVYAQATEEVYQWDFGIKNKAAWLLACFVPYALFLIGWDDLTKVVGFTGAVCGGLYGLVLIWLVFKIKARPQKVSPISNTLTRPLAYFLSSLFILGIIYEAWSVIK